MKPNPNPDYATFQPDYDVDEAWRNMESGKVDPVALAGVEPPVEEAPPPFTEAQIAFIENLMEETIKRLAVAVNVREGDNYSWYSNNEYFSVEVTLSYKKPDGPYNGEQISESSDGFTVRIPSTNNDY